MLERRKNGVWIQRASPEAASSMHIFYLTTRAPPGVKGKYAGVAHQLVPQLGLSLPTPRGIMSTTSKELNKLVCFTNCALALEDGSIVRGDLWIDETKGVILDAQVSSRCSRRL